MPPQAVPAILSASTHNLLNSSLFILFTKPFECIVTSPAHTVKALLEDSPASFGTSESIIILRPLG
jgi:hypothetical protein